MRDGSIARSPEERAENTWIAAAPVIAIGWWFCTVGWKSLIVTEKED